MRVFKILSLNFSTGLDGYVAHAQIATCEFPATIDKQTLAVRAQTSRPKFLKFRLFFHFDHVWHRFDHAFGKERLGVRVYGVKFGF